MEFITWGLRPKWLKQEQNGFINARSETVAEKPAFKKAYKSQRCLVVADGYYEWRSIEGKKQPYFISFADNAVFAFAGLWDNETCAILTTDAVGEGLRAVHERMPVIVNPDNYDNWLNNKTKTVEVEKIIAEKPHSNLQIFPVSTHVNSPQNDDLSCVQPL